jgi:hypothetical protein
MWVPRRLTTLWASMACYRDSFTFTFALKRSTPFHLSAHSRRFSSRLDYAYGGNEYEPVPRSRVPWDSEPRVARSAVSQFSQRSSSDTSTMVAQLIMKLLAS